MRDVPVVVLEGLLFEFHKASLTPAEAWARCSTADVTPQLPILSQTVGCSPSCDTAMFFSWGCTVILKDEHVFCLDLANSRIKGFFRALHYALNAKTLDKLVIGSNLRNKIGVVNPFTFNR